MNIPITNDNIAEGTETFFMTLTAVAGPGNPQIDPQLSVATIIIFDDDREYTPGYYTHYVYFAVIHNIIIIIIIHTPPCTQNSIAMYIRPFAYHWIIDYREMLGACPLVIIVTAASSSVM